MAKDAHSAPRTASDLPPLDVFQMPGPDELPTSPLSPGAAGAVRDETPLTAAPAANAWGEPGAAIEAPLPAPHPHPPEPSTPSVVIDAAALEAELESPEPTAPPDVPTVRLRSTRPPGRRLGREVLLAVIGMAFCLVLYGAGRELFADHAAPPAASTSIAAARPAEEGETETQARAAAEAESPPSPPLEPLAEEPNGDLAGSEAEVAPAREEAPAHESAVTASAPVSSAGTGRLRGSSPPKPAPGLARAVEPAAQDRAANRAKPDNVFDTPLLPPAK